MVVSEEQPFERESMYVKGTMPASSVPKVRFSLVPIMESFMSHVYDSMLVPSGIALSPMKFIGMPVHTGVYVKLGSGSSFMVMLKLLSERQELFDVTIVRIL